MEQKTEIHSCIKCHIRLNIDSKQIFNELCGIYGPQTISVCTVFRWVRVRTRIFFSFATSFANLIFFVPFFFNFEPDFEPNFGHFSPKNCLVRKKGVHLLISLIAAVDSRISIV